MANYDQRLQKLEEKMLKPKNTFPDGIAQFYKDAATCPILNQFYVNAEEWAKANHGK